jgi:hypothetical protein
MLRARKLKLKVFRHVSRSEEPGNLVRLEYLRGLSGNVIQLRWAPIRVSDNPKE